VFQATEQNLNSKEFKNEGCIKWLHSWDAQKCVSLHKYGFLVFSVVKAVEEIVNLLKGFFLDLLS